MLGHRNSIILGVVLIIAAGAGLACGDDGNGGDDDEIVNPGANSSPTASISSPNDGASYAFDEAVTLRGSGQDDEQGALDSAALTWRSDRDGELASGSPAKVLDLSTSDHTISLVVEDSEGARDTASVGITVNQFQGAARTVYGVEPLRDALVTYDLTNGSMSSVGSLGSGGTYNYPAGMADRPSDQALFIWNKSDPRATLSRVNRCTGGASAVYSSTSLETNFFALAFAPDGTLYGLGPTLVRVNPDAGTHTEIGNITLNGSDMPDIGAAAFGPDGNLLAVERTDTDTAQRLVRIDVNTAEATLVDTLSRDVGTVGSIALDADGRLWGSAYRNGEYDRDPVVFRLHAETAAVTDVRQLDSAAPTGMNFSPSCSSQPATGTLELQVATSGSAAHGYTAEISGPDADQTAVSPTDTVHFPFIETGDYQASLTDLPSSCVVTGSAGNPRTVTVHENDTTTTAFSVDCGTGSSKPSGTVVNAADNGGQASISQSTWKGSAGNMIDRDLGTQWSPAGNPDTIFSTYTLSSEARIWGDSLDIGTGGSRDVTHYVLFARTQSGGSWQQVHSVSDSISDATDGKGAHVFADTFNAVEVRLAITEHTAPELCYSSCDVPIVEYHLVGEFTTSGGNQGPTADLTYSPSSPTTGETVSFDASGSSDSDGSITEYRWDFNGDGTIDQTGTSATASHSYSSSGDYTASVTVVDDDGATASATTTVAVSGNQAPTADLTYSPSSPQTGETVTFDASGSSDSDGSITEYRWDFNGDGTIDQTGTSATASHSYSSSGDYTASVTVVDDDGATGSASVTVTVGTNSPPTADVTHSPSSPTPGQTVTFDASGSSDSDGSITEYRWDFDGDGTVDQTGTSATASHSYSSSGDYTASVTVVDDQGASDQATTTVSVNSPPAADLSHSPSSPQTGETVTFDASGSSDSDGSITEYRWDFDGDGTIEQTGTSATSSHSYSDNGSYSASVTTVDDDGAMDSATTSVSVQNRPPAADLAYSPQSPVAGESVTLDASGSADSDGSITEYRWDFNGDGTVDQTGTSATVSHVYSSPGQVSPVVTVVDDDGATDDVSTSITVMAELQVGLADPGSGGFYLNPGGSIISGTKTYQPGTSVTAAFNPGNPTWHMYRYTLDGSTSLKVDYNPMQDPRLLTVNMDQNHQLEADFQRCAGYRDPSPSPDGYTPAALSWGTDFTNGSCRYQDTSTGNTHWYYPHDPLPAEGSGVPEAWAVMMPVSSFNATATLYDWSDQIREVARSPANNLWGGDQDAVMIQANQRDSDDWLLLEHTDDVYRSFLTILTRCGRPAPHNDNQVTLNFDSDHACTREWLSSVWTNTISEPQYVQDLIFPVPSGWSSWGPDIRIDVHDVTGVDVSAVRLCLYRAPFTAESDAVKCQEGMTSGSSMTVNLDDAVSQVEGLYMVEVGTEPTASGYSPPTGSVVISIDSE